MSQHGFFNHGQHIRTIVDRTPCDKHQAPTGIPCYHIRPGVVRMESYLPGVCGSRIRSAGFIGEITPTALRQKPPGGSSSSRKR